VTDQGATGDMTMMYVIHDALRRDLNRIEPALRRLASGGPGLPVAGIKRAVGYCWAEFSSILDSHHKHEDDELWPALGRYHPPAAGLVAEMEGEHAGIDPLLTAAHAAVARALAGPATPAEAAAAAGTVVALREHLAAHLAHEERDVVPLAEQHLASYLPGYEARRAAEAGLSGLIRYLPWALDAADPARARWLTEPLPRWVRLLSPVLLRRRLRTIGPIVVG
jgi:hemerythrin-like domain-containing protein